MPPIIALTTDFGASSPYVAQMKAVLLSALPSVTLVDVTHAIAPRSIRDAEVVLRGTAFQFPVGTTHIVVVDPGVGSARQPIAVRAHGMTFVGPDNGVLALALAAPGAEAVLLDRPAFFREPLSPTFHGRDLFAPVAAELAAGLPLSQVGSPLNHWVASTLPTPTREGAALVGETLFADSFGNLLTNLPARVVPTTATLWVGDRQLPKVRTYADAAPGTLVALVGSDGYWEVAVRDGSAEATLQSARHRIRVVTEG